MTNHTDETFHIVVSLFADGASLAKSAQCSYWPLIGFIQNLPKVLQLMILDSCRAELLLLETEGIRINGKVFKIHIASVMGDTVAKNEMCGMRGVGAYNNCSVYRADVWTFLS